MAEIGKNIAYACAQLTQGNLIGMPTDTVYGLAANALDEKAVKRIYEVKKRASDKPLIAQTYSLKKASLFLKTIPLAANQLAEAFWPGALTLVMTANENIPKSMISGGDTVGVRVPNHPVALELLESLAFPLAVTSANLSSEPSATSASQVEAQIGDQIDFILDGGESHLGIESTIVGFRDEKPVILRSGAITEDEILAVLRSK